MTGFSIVSVISEIAKKLMSGRVSRVKSLKELADRKFKELEETNVLFVNLLNDLSEVANETLISIQSGKQAKAAIKKFETAVKRISDKREEGMVQRRSAYAEARAFSQNFREEGILKKLPPGVSQQIATFMAAYAAFFDRHDRYEHDLERAISAAKRISLFLRAARRYDSEGANSELRAIDEELTHIHRLADQFQSHLLVSWPTIATEYHTLSKMFAEHDLA